MSGWLIERVSDWLLIDNVLTSHLGVCHNQWCASWRLSAGITRRYAWERSKAWQSNHTNHSGYWPLKMDNSPMFPWYDTCLLFIVNPESCVITVTRQTFSYVIVSDFNSHLMCNCILLTAQDKYWHQHTMPPY